MIGVRSIAKEARVTVDGERIARLTSYYHAPDVLAEVLPHRMHGYRYWSQGAWS